MNAKFIIIAFYLVIIYVLVTPRGSLNKGRQTLFRTAVT